MSQSANEGTERIPSSNYVIYSVHTPFNLTTNVIIQLEINSYYWICVKFIKFNSE